MKNRFIWLIGLWCGIVSGAVYGAATADLACLEALHADRSLLEDGTRLPLLDMNMRSPEAEDILCKKPQRDTRGDILIVVNQLQKLHPQVYAAVCREFAQNPDALKNPDALSDSEMLDIACLDLKLDIGVCVDIGVHKSLHLDNLLCKLKRGLITREELFDPRISVEKIYELSHERFYGKNFERETNEWIARLIDADDEKCRMARKRRAAGGEEGRPAKKPKKLSAAPLTIESKS